MQDILDPTTAPTPSGEIRFVSRPDSLKGLRVGLIENTKKNSEAVLRRVAAKLEAAYGMTVETLVHKGQRAPLLDAQLEQLRGSADFAIVGIGD